MNKCKKKKFETRHAATIRKCEINIENEETTMQRVYYCHPCEAWHLTSMPEKTWFELVNSKNEYHRRFVEKEANYWIKKYKWDDL